jgi:hypothetical protein
MGDLIAFDDFKKDAMRCEVLVLFKGKSASKSMVRNSRRSGFLGSRSGISGNLGDLFEQANAVLTRHYDGDPRVPAIVAEKCTELLRVLVDNAEPE